MPTSASVSVSKSAINNKSNTSKMVLRSSGSNLRNGNSTSSLNSNVPKRISSSSSLNKSQTIANKSQISPSANSNDIKHGCLDCVSRAEYNELLKRIDFLQTEFSTIKSKSNQSSNCEEISNKITTISNRIESMIDEVSKLNETIAEIQVKLSDTEFVIESLDDSVNNHLRKYTHDYFDFNAKIGALNDRAIASNKVNIDQLISNINKFNNLLDKLHLAECNYDSAFSTISNMQFSVNSSQHQRSVHIGINDSNRGGDTYVNHRLSSKY